MWPGEAFNLAIKPNISSIQLVCLIKWHFKWVTNSDFGPCICHNFFGQPWDLVVHPWSIRFVGPFGQQSQAQLPPDPMPMICWSLSKIAGQNINDEWFTYGLWHELRDTLCGCFSEWHCNATIGAPRYSRVWYSRFWLLAVLFLFQNLIFADFSKEAYYDLTYLSLNLLALKRAALI